MKVAVTGGAGQLGTHVLRRLVADPSIEEVVSLDRREPLVVSAKLRSVSWDVRNVGIEQHLEGCEAVVHLAFMVTKRAPKELFWGVNVEGSRNVVRGAAAAGVKSIVYASSVAAYGVVAGHPNPIVESTPRKYQPDFPYSATKFEVEAFLDEFEQEHPEMAIARLRPTILVGDRMEHGLGAALRAGRVPASGSAPMPIVWDEDVADAAILAMKQRARGAFNVSADELLPPTELARAAGLQPLAAPRALVVAFARLSPYLEELGLGEAIDAAWVESGSVSMVPSSARAKTELGWAPRFPTAVSVMKHYVATVPRRLDKRLAVFFRLLAMNASKLELSDDQKRTRARVHVKLTGEGGGELGIVLDDGKLELSKLPPRPPTSVVTMPASLLIDLLAGKGDVTSAEKIGVEGDAHGRAVIGLIVDMFRQQQRAKGAQGLVTRALQKWFARERTA